MRRFAFAAVAILLSGGIVIAQGAGDPGRAQMKANGEAMATLSAMAKGERPFDQALVDSALAKFDETFRKLPTLYPESMRGVLSDARFSPSDKVWDDKAGFAASISSFGAAIADAKTKTRDLDGLKASVGAIGKQCSNCHETFRLRNG